MIPGAGGLCHRTSEGSPEFRLGFEQGGDARQRVGVCDAVGIDEDDDVAARDLEPAIACVRRTVRVSGQGDHGIRITRGDQRRLVRASVVHHHQLPAITWETGVAQRAERARQDPRGVMRGHDDG
jgi:hypothetical protein